jgi:hypothetical protein
MYEQVVTWGGLALLVILCLPLAGIQKLILEVAAWTLRFALLALLVAAAYLWFHPEQLPAEVTDRFSAVPRLRDLLPSPESPYYGASVAAPVVVALLPLLALLDVGRQLAGQRLRRIRALAARPVVAEVPVPPAEGAVQRRVDRRAAADALATAGRRVVVVERRG